MHWQTTRFLIDLTKPVVMGIVNLTPDSFSDGGRHVDPRAALRACEQMVKDGAGILDLGGESSRPGAQEVSVDEESARVLPVLKDALSLGVPVSVDTCKTEVMRRALDLGADIVNDILALRGEGAEALVAGHPACGVCLMHMQGTPRSMQQSPAYEDVVAEVGAFLSDRAAALHRQGVSPARIALDPGIGFGKSPAHNLELLRRQRELTETGRPLLIGWSRKSTLGAVTGRGADDRLAASIAAALAAAGQGASILRVHDVAATVDALKIWDAAGLLPAG